MRLSMFGFSKRHRILKTRKGACWPGFVLLSGYPFVFLKHERLRGDTQAAEAAGARGGWRR